MIIKCLVAIEMVLPKLVVWMHPLKGVKNIYCHKVSLTSWTLC